MKKEIIAVNLAVCSNGYLISLVYKAGSQGQLIPQDNLVAKDSEEAVKIIQDALLSTLGDRLKIV